MELLEISIVAIPANPNATVIERAIENGGRGGDAVSRRIARISDPRTREFIGRLASANKGMTLDSLERHIESYEETRADTRSPAQRSADMHADMVARQIESIVRLKFQRARVDADLEAAAERLDRLQGRSTSKRRLAEVARLARPGGAPSKPKWDKADALGPFGMPVLSKYGDNLDEYRADLALWRSGKVIRID